MTHNEKFEKCIMDRLCVQDARIKMLEENKARFKELQKEISTWSKKDSKHEYTTEELAHMIEVLDEYNALDKLFTDALTEHDRIKHSWYCYLNMSDFD